jgi:hypothetical protein
MTNDSARSLAREASSARFNASMSVRHPYQRTSRPSASKEGEQRN